MKKIALMIVAAGALFAAVPASAQTVVIRDGMHGDRGMHRHGRTYREGRMHRHHDVYRSRAQWRHGDRHRSRGPAVVITR